MRFTRAVAKSFLQLWHVGRISHTSMQENGHLPVAPSAIAAEGTLFTYDGMANFEKPRALETDEIAGIVESFSTGAKNALEAGFDGIEVHGANGYLLDQFLEDSTNQRTDAYGGSIENRARLLLDVGRGGRGSLRREQGRRAALARGHVQHDERLESGANLRLRRRKTRQRSVSLICTS
jgi:2,4-dienoyl-CoA reductase-like NADH-dependent reductase (Old Yellow Enzyme family)